MGHGTQPCGTEALRRSIMSLLSKLFGKGTEPVKRVRVCVECGMPLDKHKEWCAIHRAREAQAARTEALSPRTAG